MLSFALVLVYLIVYFINMVAFKLIHTYIPNLLEMLTVIVAKNLVTLTVLGVSGSVEINSSGRE